MEFEELDSNKPKSIRLSPSSIKTYKGCPRKYYYEYIEKRERTDQQHTILGNFVHKVLEEFHIYADRNMPDTWKSLMGTVASRVIDSKEEGVALRPNEPYRTLLTIASQQAAHAMLKSYLQMLAEEGIPDVRGTETRFKLQLKDNIVVSGICDRKDVDEDGIFHIKDYKTGKHSNLLDYKTKKLDTFQLEVYALAVLEEIPDIQTIRGSYLLIQDLSKKATAIFSKEKLLKTKEYLIKTAEEIMSDTTFETKESVLCGWCDHIDVCPISDVVKIKYKKIRSDKDALKKEGSINVIPYGK